MAPYRAPRLSSPPGRRSAPRPRAGPEGRIVVGWVPPCRSRSVPCRGQAARSGGRSGAGGGLLVGAGCAEPLNSALIYFFRGGWLFIFFSLLLYFCPEVRNLIRPPLTFRTKRPQKHWGDQAARERRWGLPRGPAGRERARGAAGPLVCELLGVEVSRNILVCLCSSIETSARVTWGPRIERG